MPVKGIQLTLLIGPVVPLPAPRAVIEALERVEVRSSADAVSAFTLTFRFEAQSPLNSLFLIASAQNSTPITPALRVMLVVSVNGLPQPLFDGVLTNVQVQPGGRGQPGTLTVTGDDLTRVMDSEDRSGLPFPAMPIEARVALICSRYAAYGLIPMVIPSLFPDVPIPLERIPAQQGTDLAYIRQLAQQIGYVFYIEPGPTPGTNIAYFGPEIKLGVPQPALNIDMDSHTNVDNLSFSFDATKGVLPVVYIQNPATRACLPVPIPDLNPLQPPLGAIPTPLANITRLRDTASLPISQALARGLAEAGRSQDALTASGELDVQRYGRPLRARGLVGVRGAGVAFDGLYYVASVRSTLQRGAFRQNFDLSRNGLVSTTPRIPA